MRWEREEGTSWEREGSPFRPTKIRDKPDHTGNVHSSESQKTNDTMTRAGPSASIGVPKYSATAAFLQVLAQAPLAFHTTYWQSTLYGFDSGATRCQPPPGRFRCHRRPSKKTRPQTRERLGRGVWTLAEASVECNYAASATAHPAAMSRSPALVEQQPR